MWLAESNLRKHTNHDYDNINGLLQAKNFSILKSSNIKQQMFFFHIFPLQN
jgi:hypothetical protein